MKLIKLKIGTENSNTTKFDFDTPTKAYNYYGRKFIVKFRRFTVLKRYETEINILDKRPTTRPYNYVMNYV